MPSFAHAVLVEHLDLDAELAQAPRPARPGSRDRCTLAGSETRSRVKTTASAAASSVAIGALAPRRRRRDDGQRGEGRLLLGLLRWCGIVEAIGAQLPRQRRAGPRPRRARAAPSPRSTAASPRSLRRRSDARRECRRDPAKPRVDRIGLAEPGEDDAAGGDIGRRRRSRSSSFFLPRNRGAAATARLIAPPVASSSWRAGAVSTPLLPHPDDDGAGTRQGRTRQS